MLFVSQMSYTLFLSLWVLWQYLITQYDSVLKELLEGKVPRQKGSTSHFIGAWDLQINPPREAEPQNYFFSSARVINTWKLFQIKFHYSVRYLMSMNIFLCIVGALITGIIRSLWSQRCGDDEFLIHTNFCYLTVVSLW